MNVFTFSGHIGQNAEMRSTPSGTELCQFSVAVKSGYGDRESTTWTRCTLFGKRAQSLAPYLVKGQQVVVSGEAKLHEWQDKNQVNKTSLEVNVNDVTLVGGKPKNADAVQEAAQSNAAPTDDGFGNFDLDIPF